MVELECLAKEGSRKECLHTAHILKIKKYIYIQKFVFSYHILIYCIVIHPRKKITSALHCNIFCFSYNTSSVKIKYFALVLVFVLITFKNTDGLLYIPLKQRCSELRNRECREPSCTDTE